ncbi:class I SAM-dependent methyltransferase [bacterium]|nr:class I SAM-dependent methyltransferase [candidate division CSSED10-310 bacterium]
MKRIFDLVEKGLVPDTFIRQGIRRLLAQRLKQEKRSTLEDQMEHLQTLVMMLRKSNVAVETQIANEQHYEIPASFFEILLGKHKKYSGCYFETAQTSLDEAEEKSLKMICERAGIEDGMHILELGCGWGAVSLWIAKHFPRTEVTAVSNSSNQQEYIQRKSQQRGLSNIDIIKSDMNNFSISHMFDRVVSVEMFEHMRNYDQLMERISGWLKTNGKLFVQIFCHREFAYFFEAVGITDWMGKYFFSSGIMPSEYLLLYFQKHLTIEKHWRVNGLHYTKTLHNWLINLDSNTQEIRKIFDETYGSMESEKWIMRWRIFLMACEELFRYRNGNEWYLVQYLFNNEELK